MRFSATSTSPQRQAQQVVAAFIATASSEKAIQAVGAVLSAFKSATD